MQILESRADEGLVIQRKCTALDVLFLAPTGWQAAGSPCLCPGSKCPKEVKHRIKHHLAQKPGCSHHLDNLNIYFYIYSLLDGEILKGVLVSSLVPARGTQLIYACEFI